MSRLRNGIALGIPLLLLTIVVVVVFSPFSSDTAAKQDVQVSVAEIGPVIRSFPGEGVLEPQSEVLILSPASSIIKEILKEVGSHVDQGEAIMILDPTDIQREIENIRDQMEMKQNALRKNHLNARSTRVDLEYNLQVKNLRIASLTSELADQEQLLEVGGISPARFEKTRQELELAEKDLVMLREKNAIQLEQLEADEDGLRLQIEMQEKDLAAKEEALTRMIIRAPSAGILLSIQGKVGEKVNSDRLLVEMSDLTTFKVKGSAEDDYSEEVKTGTPVFVLLDNLRLPGVVGTVSPVIRDKKVEFDVHLRESNHFKLRPQLSVGLDIVQNQRDSVVRIHNGPALGRGNDHQLYVLGPLGPRIRDVRTGLKTEEWVEVTSGLAPGERVVVSPVSSPDELETLIQP
ncbi:MAG: HlyD family efflux transporter periplasmic adaptor subunit [Bacteroidales bacterium]